MQLLYEHMQDSSAPQYRLDHHVGSEPEETEVLGVSGSVLFESVTLDRIFVQLRHLSEVRSAKRFNFSTCRGSTSYSDQVYSLQRDLHFLSTFAVNLTAIERCCSLAGLAYLHIAVCDMSSQSRAVETVIERLCVHVEQMTSSEDFYAVSHRDESVSLKIFWTLAVGYVAVEVKHNQQALIVLLKRQCAWLKYKTISERKILLETVLWNKEWDSHLPLLWEDFDNLNC